MRNIGLDLLRFFAVFLVLGRHLHLPADASPILETWKRGGWVGVDLFFVLSGFLVSSLLFKEHLRTGSIDIWRFLVRRGFKIYPAFWCMLTFTLTIQNMQGTPPPRAALLGELLFLQNSLGGIWPHTWSLAVEEHFYLGIALLFTLAMAVRKNTSFSWIPIVFAMIAIVCLAARVATVTVYPVYLHQTYCAGTHLRVDSLFFGVLLSYLYHFHELERRLSKLPTWLLVGFGALLFVPAFCFTLEETKWLPVAWVIPLYVGSGAILLAALRLPASDNFTVRVLAGLGTASYSVYLWHLPVGEWGFTFLARVTGWDNFAFYFFNYIVGSFVVGWLFSLAIEYPTLRLRNVLFPTGSSAGSTVTAPRTDPRTDPDAVRNSSESSYGEEEPRDELKRSGSIALPTVNTSAMPPVPSALRG